MKLNRLFLIAPLMCGVSSASAGDAPAPWVGVMPSGVSAGLDLQGVYSRMDIAENISQGTASLAEKTNTASAPGMGGRIFLGYTHMTDQCLFMGAEAGYGLNAFKKKVHIISDDFSVIPPVATDNVYEVKRATSMDLSLKVGGLVGKSTALYFKTGVQWTRWRLKSLLDAPTIVENPKNIEKWVPGLILGLGVQVPVGKIQLRAEAGVNLYQNTTLNINQTNGTLNAAITGKPKSEGFMTIGAVYTLPVK